MQVGDLVESPHHFIRGIIVETGHHDHDANGPVCRVKWFDGDESFEWTKFLRVISASR